MTATPRTVSKFEGRLITLTRAVVRLTPPEPAAPFLSDKTSAPPGLNSACLELVCSALAHGCVTYLAKAGWRRERFLRDDKPVDGRLWERTPLAERRLSFSRHALDFLMALTAGGKPWSPPSDGLSPADELVIFLAYDAFRDSDAGVKWRTRPAFARNPWCRLMWPEEFSATVAPEFNDCRRGLRATILEALQARLAERWLEVERGKRDFGSWTALDERSAAQDVVLDRLLPAIDGERRDLAGFLIRAAAQFCRPGIRIDDLTGQVSGAPRLTERFAVQKRAAVLARTLERLADWERQARSVGYLDEGYAAAQFFLGQWEAADAGPALGRARELLRQTEPLAARTQEERHEPSVSHSGERE